MGEELRRALQSSHLALSPWGPLRAMKSRVEIIPSWQGDHKMDTQCSQDWAFSGVLLKDHRAYEPREEGRKEARSRQSVKVLRGRHLYA